MCRAGVGPLFSPGVSGPRPAHFFLYTKQGIAYKTALTGGAVNFSGRFMITERDRIIFYIDTIVETA